TSSRTSSRARARPSRSTAFGTSCWPASAVTAGRRGSSTACPRCAIWSACTGATNSSSAATTTTRSARGTAGGRARAGPQPGVDPGLQVTGYAVLEVRPRGPHGREPGIVRPDGGDLAARVRSLYDGIVEVEKQYRPEVMALE